MSLVVSSELVLLRTQLADVTEECTQLKQMKEKIEQKAAQLVGNVYAFNKTGINYNDF